jgi:hypothetical protein
MFTGTFESHQSSSQRKRLANLPNDPGQKPGRETGQIAKLR